MNQEIAEKIIKILLTADGGCEYCVSNLLILFCNEFPEYKGLAEKAFEKSFGKKLILQKEREKECEMTPDTKNEMYHLHGWDDEKIYFWDEKRGEEYCVSDDKQLYEHLLKICIDYFKENTEKL